MFTPTWEEEDAVVWMVPGQVRDLRRGAVQEIVAARQQHAFAGLRALVSRVSLQPKEITHLTQCGALDVLEPNRAALLAEEEEVSRTGSALQGGRRGYSTAVESPKTCTSLIGTSRAHR